MKKQTKFFLCEAAAYFVVFLLIPVLISSLPSDDVDGRIAFQQLSREIREYPNRNVYELTRISNRGKHMIDVVMREDNWNEYKITYRRKERSLREEGINLSQKWENVTDDAIHAVATEHATYPNPAQHGCQDVRP